jgi:hypothetical protein
MRLERWRQTQEEACRQRFNATCLRFEIRKHLADDGFLEDHARKNKDNLLAQRSRIIEAYYRLQEDTALVSMLRAKRPDIYQRAIWEMQALNFAEQIDVERPAPAPAPVAAPKKKETPEQYSARKIRREQHRIQDKIAMGQARLTGAFKAREMVSRYPLLDPDERLRHEAEIVGKIMDDNDPKGTTVL